MARSDDLNQGFIDSSIATSQNEITNTSFSLNADVPDLEPNASELIKFNLGKVQETLFIPLYGRACESAKHNPMLIDHKAVSIVECIDYDFSKWDKAPSLFASCYRTLMFDDLITGFLEAHPYATIVEMGCGLNTRFERIDNGKARWFELDLPDVIEMRRQFFNDEPRRTMLATSALDTQWFSQIERTDAPILFISEAMLIYLQKSHVRDLIKQLSTHFDSAHLLLDTVSTHMVENQASHDAMKHLSKDSWFVWGCDDPHLATSWAKNSELVTSLVFTQAPRHLRQHLPLSAQMMLMTTPWLAHQMAQDYKINWYRW